MNNIVVCSEYVPAPCVHLPFYPSDQAVKIMSNWDNTIVMCGDKRIPSAGNACCDSSRPDWATDWSLYRDELLTYRGNQERCPNVHDGSDILSDCDVRRFGPLTGRLRHCLYRQNCEDLRGFLLDYIHRTRFHWTTASCNIQVKVDEDGLIAIVHDPAQTKKKWTPNTEYPDVMSHVDGTSTVSYFHVQWEDTCKCIFLTH